MFWYVVRRMAPSGVPWCCIWVQYTAAQVYPASSWHKLRHSTGDDLLLYIRL